ncbi:MAG: hypothetical protein N2166_02745 [candidate division WOR-3 bacterium]|nr:hypothetical protein [candidate division WOR-3 bacterium]
MKTWTVGLFILLMLSCYTIRKFEPQRSLKETFEISVESIPYRALDNLKKSYSFCYRYSFQSDQPNNIQGDFNGKVILPNKEERRGRLVVNRRTSKIFVRARGEYQYEVNFKTNKYQRVSRTDENNLLTIIERTVGNSKFYPISREALKDYGFEKVLNIVYNDKKYYYSFWPNLAFLDPTFSRKFKAIMIIDKKTLRVEKIYAADETKTVQFKIELFDYNKARDIEFPVFYDWKAEVKFLAPEKGVNYREYASIINGRFREFESAIKIRSQRRWLKVVGLVLEFESSKFLDERTIRRLLTQKGMLYVLGLKETKPETLYLQASDIKEVNLTDNDIEIVFQSEAVSKTVDFFKRITSSYLQWYLDDEYIGETTIDKADFSSKINIFTNISNVERKIFKALVTNKMLRGELNIKLFKESG